MRLIVCFVLFVCYGEVFWTVCPLVSLVLGTVGKLSPRIGAQNLFPVAFGPTMWEL